MARVFVEQISVRVFFFFFFSFCMGVCVASVRHVCLSSAVAGGRWGRDDVAHKSSAHCVLFVEYDNYILESAHDNI